MAENRGRRAEELLGRVGSRRAREDPVPEVVDAGGDVSKRRRVGDDPPRDFEHAFELEKEEHMIMEVDAVNSIHIMGTVHTMDRIEGGEQVPFSPPACSPSRRPWQLRPTPETIPDDHGRLTREWLPPVSPYGLIEEDQMVFRDPFKLLVVCQLLNKTGATMVRHIVYREGFFDRYPSPRSLMDADMDALGALLRPLGLWRRRAAGLKRFAREFHELFWDVYTDSYKVNAYTRVGDLYGCGEYAVDAVRCCVVIVTTSRRPAVSLLCRVSHSLVLQYDIFVLGAYVDCALFYFEGPGGSDETL
jgi:endonuclease III